VISAAPSLPGPRDDLCSRALETDRSYFEMGARLKPLPGAVLAWMPGLTECAAGAVIHRVDTAIVGPLAGSWVSAAESAFRSAGATLARIYLDAPDPQVADLLDNAGYQRREELLFGHDLPPPSPGLRLHPVRSEADWQRKRRFHEMVEESPDGHPNRACDWVALERCKCRHGMQAYWAEVDGEVAGMIGLIRGDGIARLKNLVVHPAYRRQSVGIAIMAHAAVISRAEGLPCQCVLAVSGEAGEQLYRAAGMKVIGSQFEWSKPLARA
jgi:ribosomal protein S18 acetylase RimI-like enzyme